MLKLLIIAAAIIAVAFAVPVEKRRVPSYKLLSRHDPFPGAPEPEIQPPTTSNILLLNVTQRVDNFDPSNLDTYEQRYYMNDDYYVPGAPIFLFLAGEWIISPYRLNYSLMHDIARENNGALFYLEHRYYGESRPTPDVSNANLRFLTPEQALADAAQFVNHIRATVYGSVRSSIVVVGGHYSASLAVWFRQRYPHLTIGAWASSPPLPSVVDFDQFKVATGQAYRAVGGDACYDNLALGFSQVQDLINAGNFQNVTDTFYLCDILELEDLPHFFSLMAELYAILPQFETEEYILDTCNYIIQEGGTVASIAFILENIIDVVGGECIDIDYDSIVDAERETEWDSPAVAIGYRQWSYQLCSQIGWFHTSGSPNQPFGNTFPVDVYHAGCSAVFGETFTAARLLTNSARFNALYGGLEPVLTNTVFVYGEHDPWSIIGRRTNLSDTAISLIIPGGTLGNDLGPLSNDNPEALRIVKLQIQEIILQWFEDASN